MGSDATYILLLLAVIYVIIIIVVVFAVVVVIIIILIIIIVIIIVIIVIIIILIIIIIINIIDNDAAICPALSTYTHTLACTRANSQAKRSGAHTHSGFSCQDVRDQEATVVAEQEKVVCNVARVAATSSS